MTLGILLTDILNGQLFLCHGIFVLECFVVVLDELQHGFDDVFVGIAVLVVILQVETFHPRCFVQVQQHLLLQLVLAVIDGDGVVMSVQAVDQRLDAWFLEMAEI